MDEHVGGLWGTLTVPSMCHVSMDLHEGLQMSGRGMLWIRGLSSVQHPRKVLIFYPGPIS